MKSTTSVSVMVVAISIGSSVWAQSGLEVERHPARPKHTAKDKAGKQSPVSRFLALPVEQVAWDRTPLGNVLEWLEDRMDADGRISISPHWHALNAMGIDQNTPIDLEMRRTTVAEILEEVLAALSLDDPLVYLGHGSNLEITSQSDMRREVVTLEYDVRDLLVPRYKPIEARASRLDTVRYARLIHALKHTGDR